MGYLKDLFLNEVEIALPCLILCDGWLYRWNCLRSLERVTSEDLGLAWDLMVDWVVGFALDSA